MAVRRPLALLLVLLGSLLAPAVAAASTDQSDWPAYDLLLMNKLDGSRPLDARPGMDPFGGQDPDYRCDAVHLAIKGCRAYVVACRTALCPPGSKVVSDVPKHARLLGGHGSDTIHAGPWGDVLWGDYKPSGQPTSQVDVLVGGAGDDFIYGSHGINRIDAGPGDDYVKLHFGRGSVDCGGGTDVLYISRKAQRRTTITGCETISHATLGY